MVVSLQEVHGHCQHSKNCTINKTGSDGVAPADSTTSIKASEEGMIPTYSPTSGLVKTPEVSGLTRFST